MADATDLIQPAAGAPPAADPSAVQPQQPPEGGESQPQETSENAPKLAPALLHIPAMQALMVGKPAAASVHFTHDKALPVAKEIFDHKEDLLKAGFALYRSLSGDVGVIFNQLYLHPEELKAADQAGQLMQIAPPLGQLNHATGAAGRNHPIFSHAGVPGGPKPAPMPQVPQSGMAQPAPIAAGPGPTMPADVQRQLLQAKLANIPLGAPTSGPSPGAGRILNTLQKPVV